MEWLEEERDERQKQRDMLKRDIQKAVEGVDERFVDFTQQIKDKMVRQLDLIFEITLFKCDLRFNLDKKMGYLISFHLYIILKFANK